MTPGSRAAILAELAESGATKNSEVTSPSPTSSSSAAWMRFRTEEGSAVMGAGAKARKTEGWARQMMECRIKSKVKWRMPGFKQDGRSRREPPLPAQEVQPGSRGAPLLGCSCGERAVIRPLSHV